MVEEPKPETEATGEQDWMSFRTVNCSNLPQSARRKKKTKSSLSHLCLTECLSQSGTSCLIFERAAQQFEKDLAGESKIRFVMRLHTSVTSGIQNLAHCFWSEARGSSEVGSSFAQPFSSDPDIAVPKFSQAICG